MSIYANVVTERSALIRRKKKPSTRYLCFAGEKFPPERAISLPLEYHSQPNLYRRPPLQDVRSVQVASQLSSLKSSPK